MNFVSLLGTAGTLLGLIRAVPQLVRLLRAREAFGVSLDTAATSSIVSFGWVVYGILTGQPYVTFAAGSSSVIFALIALSSSILLSNLEYHIVTNQKSLNIPLRGN